MNVVSVTNINCKIIFEGFRSFSVFPWLVRTKD